MRELDAAQTWAHVDWGLQAACAAGALAVARKVYYASSPPAVTPSSQGTQAAKTASKGHVDSVTLKERETAGVNALQGVGVKEGSVVMVATQLLEAVEVYSYCSAAKAKAVVFAPGQSVAAVTEKALAEEPRVFVYDTRALEGVASVEAAMQGAGIECHFLFVAGNERERSSILAQHPAHAALDLLVEQGLAKAAQSVPEGVVARGATQPPLPNFIAEFNQGVQAIGDGAFLAVGSLMAAGKAPKPPLKGPAPDKPDEKDLVRL